MRTPLPSITLKAMMEDEFEDDIDGSSSDGGDAYFDEDLDVTNDNNFDIQPYMFEPEWQSDEEDHVPAAEADVGPDRRENTGWCTCGHCQPLDSREECVCCREIQSVLERMERAPGEEKPRCITEHPGFQSVVLDVDVLETAYYVYRQHHGPLNLTHNSQYRYVAYRQLCRWCWKWLGKRIRVILPACCIHKILDEFPLGPEEERTGYRDPH